MLSASRPPGLHARGDREDAIKRCAIYTRKSSAEAVERSLSTLDAQRQFCEAYIASQAGDGWVATETRYDDGGFSGGSLARPAVRRLMNDIAAGLVDVVVVYKIDRLSRSLIDFSRLLGDFDAYGVCFVSVTQAFNTSCSMGRLTLNVLLSFAQFERELASERLRDKAAASRARGLWQGGPRPFGYHVEKGRLIVDPREARIVCRMFNRYPEIGAARLLANELTADGVLNRTGRPFQASNVIRLLKNRLYRGDLVHRGTPIRGIHEPIVSEEAWSMVKQAMAEVFRRHRPFARPPMPNPLKGRVFGPSGRPLSHTFCHNRETVHRYYLPTGRHRYGTGDHYRADDVDAAVLAAIQPFVTTKGSDDRGGDGPATLNRLVSRIDIGEREIVVALRTGAIVKTLIAGRLET